MTLEDMINSRDYPGCVEEALTGRVSDSDDFAKRTNAVAKRVLRRCSSPSAGCTTSASCTGT